MGIEPIIERISGHTGLERHGARAACSAVLEALGGSVPDTRHVARWLPPELAEAFTRGAGAAIESLDGFYARVSRALGQPESHALEEAHAVCHALAEHLDAEAVKLLRTHLPGDVADLLVTPPSVRPPERPLHPRSGHTLAEGRPGSDHPISSEAPRPQGESVARPAPHGERKLSTGHPSADDDDHTLARGRAGSDRPVSES